MKTTTQVCTVLFLISSCLLSTVSTAQKISGGASFTFVVCDNGNVWAWGANNLGQIGVTPMGYLISVPTQNSLLTNILTIDAGSNHCLALKNDNTVWTWGDNQYGQLGNGTTGYAIVAPIQVSFLSSVTSVAGGGQHSLARKNDGTIWAWGLNNWGQLGTGNNISYSAAVQISSLTNIKNISAGSGHSLALKNDSTVWAWGINGCGQLGYGIYSDTNLPVQVSSLTSIIAIKAGEAHSLALKNDGTVWAWGCNDKGQLGNGTNDESWVPTQVIGLTDVVDIASDEGSFPAAGGAHSLALKNDGTVWAWGRNTEGQLGNGNNINSNIPVQVIGISGITSIEAGDLHSIALKNDGSVWVWGYGQWGQLGNGNQINSTIPIIVSGLCPVSNAVNKLKDSISVSVFPNPAVDVLYVNINKNSTDASTLNIYNCMGSLVKSKLLLQNYQQISIGDLSNGIYLLEIKTKKWTDKQKLTIQR